MVTMAPRQKSIVIYYDFSDVLESSTASVSSGDLSPSSKDSSNNKEKDRSPSPRRPRDWLLGNGQAPSYQYNLQLFDTRKYDNAHHTWQKKPFAVRSMPAFFGAARQQMLGRIVHRNRAKLAHDGFFEPEGLVLTEGTTPFRNKLLFAIKMDSEDDEPLPKGMQVEYLSGTFLSKVFLGHEKDFSKWYHSTISAVQKANGIRPNQKHDCFTYHPTSSKTCVPQGYSLIAVFIKVSDE